MNEAERLNLLRHFKDEVGEHAVALSEAVLALESRPRDAAVIADMLRRAHSLKGAARLVGAAVIESLANALETVVGELRSGRLAASRKVTDVLLEVVDGVRAAAESLLEGRPEGGEEVLSRLLSLASSALGLDESLRRYLPGLPPGVLAVLTEFQKSRLLFSLDSGRTCWEAELTAPTAEFAARAAGALAALKKAGEVVSLTGRNTPGGPLSFKFIFSSRLSAEQVMQAGAGLLLPIRNLALPLPDGRQALPPQLSREEAAAEEAFAREVANLRGQYISEAFDKIEDMSRIILAVEQRPGDQELVNELFRAAHNFKGSGSVFGLDEVSKLAHHMETLISAVRGGSCKMSARVTSALLKGADTLKDLFSRARAGGAPDDRPLPVVKELEAALSPDSAPDETAPAAAVRAPVRAESIRVSLAKLDRMVNLADELTISRNTTEAAVSDIEALAGEAKALLRDLGTFGENLGSGSRQAACGIVAGRISRLKDGLEGLSNRFGAATIHSENVIDALQHDVRRIRMVPVSALFDSAPRLVRDLTADKVKKARLIISGADTELDKRVLELMADPLMHLIRNAVDHGLELPEARLKAGKPEAGSIELSAEHRGSFAVIVIKDDGRGLDPRQLAAKALEKGLITPQEAEKLTPEQAYALIFLPGFSTKGTVTSISGRGVGMDVVKSNVENLKGRIEIETFLGRGLVFRIFLPLSVSIAQAVTIEAAGLTFCLQADAIVEIIRAPEAEVLSEDGKACIRHRGATVPVVRLSDLLGLKNNITDPGLLTIVLLKGLEGTIGFTVDRALKEQTVVVKEICAPFGGLPHVAGGTILADGSVSVVLDSATLIQAAVRTGGTWTHQAPEALRKKKIVLVADDSLTTRELLRGLIESAGYAVELARSGTEAWGLLCRRRFDLVVSDISMPGMDGYELTAKVRADSRFSGLPLILLTALSKEEERLRGLQAGASAYITKGAFDQTNLLERIRELAGHDE